MNLTGLNDKDISRAALEGLAVDRPHSPAFTDELDLVIRVAVRARSRTGLPLEQERRNTSVALLSSNKLMRTTNKRQILLAHVMHPVSPPARHWMCVATIGSQEERAAWVSHELGRKQVCLGPYPIRVARGKSPQKAEQSQHGTREPFYRSGDKTMAVETSTAPSFARARHGQLFEGH